MVQRPLRVLIFLFFVFLFASAIPSFAQDNYEIQVYPGDTLEAGKTMFEFHSNFTVQGRKDVEDGVQPTNHAFHETLEITHGVTPWFEVGWYVFSSIQQGSWQWVGDHIRPRVAVPASWKWPVGVSVSTEIGYVRPKFSADTWTIELRPIIDKQAGKWYLAFNPTMDKSFRGPEASRGLEFSPNVKVGYNVTKKAQVGIEYYGSMGPIGGFDPLREQEMQIFPSLDLDLSPKWEINAGVGWGTTRSTDHLIVKGIIGYRFDRFPLIHGVK